MSQQAEQTEQPESEQAIANPEKQELHEQAQRQKETVITREREQFEKEARDSDSNRGNTEEEKQQSELRQRTTLANIQDPSYNPFAE